MERAIDGRTDVTTLIEHDGEAVARRRNLKETRERPLNQTSNQMRNEQIVWSWNEYLTSD